MLILASASPRRRDLLGRTGLRFRVRPADLDERAREGEAPRALAERLAREKAAAVASEAGPGDVVLGSDTVVVLEGELLGKPRDPAHAEAMLARLQGRTHTVITGVATARQRGARIESLAVESRVTLRALAPHEIRAYVATGEPLDKAGSYALQGEGGRFVERVEGSETNVIGLPVEETLALLRRAEIAPPGREQR